MINRNKFRDIQVIKFSSVYYILNNYELHFFYVIKRKTSILNRVFFLRNCKFGCDFCLHV